MAEQPLVSVIIPMYNAEQFIAQTLDSVLAQDYPHIEILVVDDGSTDGGAAIVTTQYPMVRYIKQPNGGPSAARNRGVQLAQGTWLAFIDADDQWLPTKISRQMAYSEHHGGVDYLLTFMEVFVEEGTVFPASFNQKHYESKPIGYLPSTLVVRRDSFLRVGFFNEQLRVSEDADWFFRAKDAGLSLVVIPEVLLRRRIHAANLTRETDSIQQRLLLAVKMSIDRKKNKS